MLIGWHTVLFPALKHGLAVKQNLALLAIFRDSRSAAMNRTEDGRDHPFTDVDDAFKDLQIP